MGNQQVHGNSESFHRDVRGSFTLEASMLFPMILIITFCLIFFSIVIYHKSILQFEANRIADQVTYVWSNSEKDPETGEFAEYTTARGHDGLYWRLTSNNFLSQFNLPNIGNSSLVTKKERQELVDNINSPAQGYVEFQNGILGNEVTVTLEQPIPLPSMFIDILGVDIMTAESTRTITEPVEFIRNTDFVVYFTQKITDRVSGYFDVFNSSD